MGLLPIYKRLVLLNNTAYSELPDRTDQKFRQIEIAKEAWFHIAYG
jgi:hypothetical protein